jgi:hypothetical protein
MKWKLILIIPMAALELLCIGIAWIIAFINPHFGEKAALFLMRRFPDKEWYYE